MARKKDTEICVKEQILERADDGMNMKREKGYADLLYSSLKEGINRRQRNAEKKSQLLRKSCKHNVG